MERFCAAERIPHEICGKVIVAVDDSELPALEKLHQRGQQNGVRCELIDADGLHRLEPGAAGVAAIHVPEAGIVDYVAVCRRLAARVIAGGGELRTGSRLRAIHTGANLRLEVAGGGDAGIEVDVAVNCAGLHADRVARLAGLEPPARIVPFRGEYYAIEPGGAGSDGADIPCRNLIYPVPDARLPFLGVHLTRRIDGRVECGPNAVLALAREGYGKLSLSPRDAADALLYPGFLRLARRYWRTGAAEMWRSMSKAAFVAALRRLVPSLRAEQLVPAPAGVRAQAIRRDGTMVDDFLFARSDRMVHVINAPSPAATASLNIAELICDEVAAVV